MIIIALKIQPFPYASKIWKIKLHFLAMTDDRAGHHYIIVHMVILVVFLHSRHIAYPLAHTHPAHTHAHTHPAHTHPAHTNPAHTHAHTHAHTYS